MPNESDLSGEPPVAGRFDRKAACEAHNEMWERANAAIEAARAWSDAKFSEEYAALAARTEDAALAAEFTRVSEQMLVPNSEAKLDRIRDMCSE